MSVQGDLSLNIMRLISFYFPGNNTSCGHFRKLERSEFLSSTVAFITEDVNVHFVPHSCYLKAVTSQTTTLLTVLSNNRRLQRMDFSPNSIILQMTSETFKQYPFESKFYRSNKLFNGRARILIIGDSTLYFDLRSIWNAIDIVAYQNGQFLTLASPLCQEVPVVEVLEYPFSRPKNLSDFLGCEVYASYINFYPFAEKNGVGIEVKLFKTMMEKLKLRFFLVPAGYYSNSFFDVHLGFLPYDLVFFYQYDPVVSHSTETYVWVYPSGKPISGFSLLYLAFTPTVWAIYLISSLGVFFGSYINSNGQILYSFSQSFAYVLAVGYKSKQTDKNRAFAVVNYFCSVCLTTAYQATLFYLMQTIPHDSPLATLTDLGNSKLIHYYCGNKENRETSVYPDNLFQDGKHEFFPGKLPIKEIADGNSYSLLPLSMFSFKYKDREPYVDKHMYPSLSYLPSPRYSVGISFMMPHGHYLYDAFNDVTLRLVEAGFVQHWTSLYKLPPGFVQEKVNAPISLVNLEGAFFLWSGLLALAFIIFLYEYLSIFLKKCYA